MKVGDLVCHTQQESQIGIVVETGRYAGNGNIMILWCGVGDGEPHVHNRSFIKLLTPS